MMRLDLSIDGEEEALVRRAMDLYGLSASAAARLLIRWAQVPGLSGKTPEAPGPAAVEAMPDVSRSLPEDPGESGEEDEPPSSNPFRDATAS